jgi:PIN domain nuclease of toxin-antitoxin system
VILLDTIALIWLTLDEPIRANARSAIIEAAANGDLAVSAASAWEVGLLATRTSKSRTIFTGDARNWFATAVSRARLRLLPIDADTALEAADLPGLFHCDPSDRWIVATARRHSATLITSDRRILAYSDAGHVSAIHA